MYWKEDNQDNSNKTDDKIVDISFKVNCAKISADHAYDLFKAVIKRFPQINKIDMSTPDLLAKTDAKMIAALSVRDYFRYILMTLVGQGAGDRIG